MCENEFPKDYLWTPAAIERARRYWQRIAEGEEIQVEKISGGIYAFGSEIATLRLLQYYRRNERATAGFSKSLDVFYFCLDI